MLGDKFINVMDDGSPDVSRDPLSFRLVSGLTGRLILLARELPSSARWTLYLSEGGVLEADVDLPAHITLELAPRVRIGLGAATLTIRGASVLGREPRFDLRRGGRVRLWGPIDEILPIWWFVRGDMGASAIEAAAASALSRADEDLAQIPVVVDRPFRIDRTVSLHWEDPSRPGERRELIVQGRHPLGSDSDRASIYSHDVPALLRIVGQISVVFSDLGFYSVIPTTGTTRAALVEMVGDLDGSAFERCTFISLRQSFLSLCYLPTLGSGEYERAREVLEGRQAASASELARLRSEVDVERVGMLRVECCSMKRSEHFIAEDGVVVHRGARLLLNVDSCSFVSGAGHVIAVAVGSLNIQDCSFEMVHAGNPYLDQKNVVVENFKERDGEPFVASRLWSALVVGEIEPDGVLPSRARRSPPIALPSVNLVATHLQVRGMALLAGAPLAPSGTEMQMTLNNALHSGADRGAFAIDLRGAKLTGCLVMQGCTLGGYARVFEENPGDFRVLDVGTRFSLGASFLTSRPVIRPVHTVPT